MSGEPIMPANPTKMMEYSVKLTRTTTEVAEVIVFIEDVNGISIGDMAIMKANATKAWGAPESAISVSQSRQESTGEYLPKINRDWGSDVR